MPITKRKIRNHFQYSFWKYLLLAVIAIFGWNLIYTTTRYQSPENLKVEFYAEVGALGGLDVQTLADTIHQEVMPEMEEVTATSITYDETYGDMQLYVWVSAAQGDVYLISNDRFTSLAQNQALMDLAPYIESGELDTAGLDLTAGYVNDSETGKTTLYGIPADTLTGLSDYGLVTEDSALCLLVNGGNEEYALKFLNYLLENMRGSEEEAATDATATVSPEVTEAP